MRLWLVSMLALSLSACGGGAGSGSGSAPPAAPEGGALTLTVNGARVPWKLSQCYFAPGEEEVPALIELRGPDVYLVATLTGEPRTGQRYALDNKVGAERSMLGFPGPLGRADVLGGWLEIDTLRSGDWTGRIEVQLRAKNGAPMTLTGTIESTYVRSGG